MKTPKKIIYISFIINLILASALFEYSVSQAKNKLSFAPPEEIFPVILIQQINSKLHALNLFHKEVYLDGKELAPAVINNHRVLATEIIRRPLQIEWEKKITSFPSDFAKEAPHIVNIEEKATCQICQRSDDNWLIKKGNYDINEIIVIPQNKKLIIEAGTSLRFSEKGGIFTRSPLVALGNKKDFISFKGLSWKGITVLNQTSEKSILRNCHIEGATGFEIFGMKYTGTLNFILGEIDLADLTFKDSLAEDALNVKWTNGILSRLSFSNSFSDALDADWSNLKIEKIDISKTGNDCLDLSGGKIIIKEGKFSGCGDKGISNGENNLLIANDVIISQSKTAIANKDGAELRLENARISFTELAFHQYHHKTFYKEPLGFLYKNIEISQVNNKIKIEAGQVTGHESL